MPTASDAPFRCPGCGEERLLEGDARGWTCAVCGQHGPRRPAPAPSNGVPHLLTALVQAHLGADEWQVAAIAPLTHWRPALQRELVEAVGALHGDTVIVVLERVRQ